MWASLGAGTPGPRFGLDDFILERRTGRVVSAWAVGVRWL